MDVMGSHTAQWCGGAKTQFLARSAKSEVKRQARRESAELLKPGSHTAHKMGAHHNG
jgi:hypothetical protein